LQVYGELQKKGTVDQAENWHAGAQYNANGIGLLRYVIIAVVPVWFKCGFFEITKYGNVSYFLMEFHKTKPAIEFYDLDNLYL
jgi:hypothetical protein